MNTKTLTITINNLPANDIDGIWKALADDSHPMLKSVISPTDNIVIDYNVVIGIDEDTVGALLGAAIGCQIAMTMNEKLTTPQKSE